MERFCNFIQLLEPLAECKCNTSYKLRTDFWVRILIIIKTTENIIGLFLILSSII